MIKENELERLGMNDLVAYYNATKALKEYYRNEAVLNECYKNTKKKDLYSEPINKQQQCSNVESKIMNEFKKRLIDDEQTDVMGQN